MCQGVAAIIFEQGVMKNKGYDHFFLFKMAEIGGGYNLGSGKQLLAITVSFRINKSGFRG